MSFLAIFCEVWKFIVCSILCGICVIICFAPLMLAIILESAWWLLVEIPIFPLGLALGLWIAVKYCYD